MPELKIESQRENKLLHRNEIRYRVTFTGKATPSKTAIKELIAKNMGVNGELVILDSNVQETGKAEVIGYSKVYLDKASAMLYEPDYELIRNGLKAKEEKS
jgi:small subunit ribosomal protein S24e